jgi:hypothetical protein
VFAVAGVAGDGVLLGVTFRPGTSSGVSDPRDAFVVVDPQTRAVQVIHRFTSGSTQVLFPDADSEWITWAEAARQPGFEDWILYSFNRRAGEIHTIAKAAAQRDGQPVPTRWIEPKVDHGMVVWSAGTADEPLGSHIDSFVASASGDSPPQLLAHDAINPVISWPYVFYGQRRSPEPGTGLQGMIVDLKSGQKRALNVISPLYTALSGVSLVWVDEHGKVLHLHQVDSDADQIVVDVSNDPLGFIQFPYSNGRIIAWGQDKGAWAYDSRNHVRVELAAVHGYGYTFMRANTLAWLDSIPPGSTDRDRSVVRLIDLSNLG